MGDNEDFGIYPFTTPLFPFFLTEEEGAFNAYRVGDEGINY